MTRYFLWIHTCLRIKKKITHCDVFKDNQQRNQVILIIIGSQFARQSLTAITDSHANRLACVENKSVAWKLHACKFKIIEIVVITTQQ